jgi:terminase small subunit-like protein
MKMKTRVWADPKIEADRVVQDLARLAFANISDFVQFKGNEVIEVDYVKAQNAGAKVKITTRTVGRGKNKRTVHETHIELPKQLAALIQLGKHLGFFPTAGKRRSS